MKGWAAFDYARSLELCVIPGIPGVKRPLCEWKAYQSRRPTDVEVTSWRRDWVRIDPLMITGSVSGVLVLDQDGVEGYVTLARREKPPATVTVLTPRGDFHEHYWFKYPAGLGRVPNFAGGYADDLPHVDLRGDGGLAKFPGGTDTQGRQYRFAPGRGPGEVEIAELPGWLYDYIAAHVKSLDAQKAQAERLQRFREESVVLRLRKERQGGRDYSDRMAHYAEAALRAQTAKVADASHGQRNTQLNRAAYSLAAFLNEGVWTETELEEALERAAIEAGLDRDPNCGMAGIQRTIRSGIRAGQGNRIAPLTDRPAPRARS